MFTTTKVSDAKSPLYEHSIQRRGQFSSREFRGLHSVVGISLKPRLLFYDFGSNKQTNEILFSNKNGVKRSVTRLNGGPMGYAEFIAIKV